MDLTTIDRPLSRDLDVLRCPGCGRALQPANETPITDGEVSFRCDRCDETFPVIDGIPHMLLTPMREAVMGSGPQDGADTRQVATAQSFGFEWSRFPEMRDEWERNFLEYVAPHGPGSFHGKRVLDAGCGSGRHAYYAAQYGAEVWAIDLGPAVEVARRNTERCDAVHVVQADLYKPPFAPESFDFIYSLGVLHHLPDPEAGFHSLLRYLKPGGEIQVFLYWQPEGQPLKRGLLAVVSAVRQLTTRLPYRMVHAALVPRGMAGIRPLRLALLGAQADPGIGQDGRADSHEAVRTLSIPRLRQRPARPPLRPHREPVQKGGGRGLAGCAPASRTWSSIPTAAGWRRVGNRPR